MKELAFKWALKNAVEHDGKAQAGAVIPKMIGEQPELKESIKEVAKAAALAVKEITALTPEDQKKTLQRIAPELLEKKKEEKHDVPNLPDAEMGKVVMLFPPEPSKYATIGHAKASLLNYLCSQKYKGTFLIRFEDTNCEKIKKEYYQAMLNDLAWLGEKWNKVDYESDHVEKFYDYAKRLIEQGNAYMCNCTPEETHKRREEGKACVHRSNSTEENLKLWKEMLAKKFKEGEYSLRAKIDMEHKNSTMRDPTIMRMLVGEHPRVGKKYFVWPTYDFATAVMDDIEKTTHRLRSKEFEMRAELQQWIQEKLGIKSPIVIEFARFNLEGVPSSGRIIREKLASGELLGWDDPRLPTLIALRKRGILPEAIKNFVINTGISKTESTISWDVLEAENRKIIEPLADRYFMVTDSIKLSVKGIPKNYTADRQLHPDFARHGLLAYRADTEEKFLVVKKDFEGAKKGDVFRLMDLMNIKITKTGKTSIEAEFESKEYRQGLKVVQWVFANENIPVEILMTDAKTVKGVVENAVEHLKVDDIIQFVRFGFCRLDAVETGNKAAKGKTLKFRYTHK